MRIVIVGGTGTIGKSVAGALQDSHEIVTAGSTSGDYRVNMGDKDSIAAFYQAAGHFDALVCAAGVSYLGPVTELQESHVRIGLENKLLGQINLVLAGLPYINDGGSFTLTSGILAEEPIAQGVVATTVDAAINGFVKAAAVELPRGLRINVVAPGVIEDSVQLHPFFPGHIPVKIDRVRAAYVKSVLGVLNGEVLRVY